MFQIFLFGCFSTGFHSARALKNMHVPLNSCILMKYLQQPQQRGKKLDPL